MVIGCCDPSVNRHSLQYRTFTADVSISVHVYGVIIYIHVLIYSDLLMVKSINSNLELSKVFASHVVSPINMFIQILYYFNKQQICD